MSHDNPAKSSEPRWGDSRDREARDEPPKQKELPSIQQIIDGSSHCVVVDGTGKVHDAVKAKISDLRLVERELAQMAREKAELEAKIAECNKDARIDLTPQELADLCTFSFGMSCDAPEDAMPITIGCIPEHEDGPGWYVWGQEYPEEGSVPVHKSITAGSGK